MSQQYTPNFFIFLKTKICILGLETRLAIV
jgi:hypothetical protein